MSVLPPRIHTRDLSDSIPPQPVYSTNPNEETLKAGVRVGFWLIEAHRPPLKPHGEPLKTFC
jgi:hypothetical protein